MKKIAFCLMTACLLLTFNPYQSNAATTLATPVPQSATSTEAKANSLLTRLDEINTMDKSNLTSPEKKNLNKEVRSIKHKLMVTGDGVYLSVGAVIIILLLLIILL